MASSSEMVTVGCKVTKETKEELEAEAYEKSSPGEQVTVSEVLRSVVRKHLGKDPESDGAGEGDAGELKEAG